MCLTCGAVHQATVTDHQDVLFTGERLGQLEVRVLDLHHRLDDVLLQEKNCKKCEMSEMSTQNRDTFLLFKVYYSTT